MQTRVVSSAESDSNLAGKELAVKLREGFSVSPKAVVIFAAPEHEHETLLRAVQAELPDSLLVGASSAGEFTNTTVGQGTVCALGLSGDDASFAVSVGRGLKGNPVAAARQIAAGLTTHAPAFPFRSALVMTDALAGHADILVNELTVATAGQHQFFGGGAGDNAQFRRTTVFAGAEVLTDAAVALEILSTKRLGVGVSHGWRPSSEAYRVTEVDGMRLISLDGFPAIEIFEEHAEATGQRLDRKEPLPHFLHNIIGIDTGAGYRLRVPLAAGDDGSVFCAAEVPEGALVRIMRTDPAAAINAADNAAQAASAAVTGPFSGALFFDCVATRLRMGEEFNTELSSLQQRFSDIPFTGCNTHGQIARAQGQFDGFHNCTAVVCVFPE